ncbi:hypothetical protein CAPI_02950 [Corynebacterium capitovis DSM 44611]|uniref:glycosyltransferase n=1 Tax=Corynebacterium capitovis TaxID=131081 RepID=UPI000377174A|nr:glycosyltransferase [Corynebacterium capitovis]WKD57154.1 hypothetical protein CAPI_02950 [Corynebacterium capitovis DSM 44611]
MNHLIVGPSTHGVTAYALALAEAVNAPVLREETFSDNPLPSGPVHVTFTDHLLGPSPADAVDALLARLGDRPFSISLHDIPQPEEGEDRFSRRAAAYRRVADAATLAVVNSRHEASFFDGDPTVIRLPIPRIESTFDPVPGTVGVLGYLYPGKGHEDLISSLGGSHTLRFLGSVSPGHEDWAKRLAPYAEITGWIDDAQLAVEMGRTEVPVCAHRHFSASGSLMTWLGAGRTVLATDSAYTREIDEWLPGRVTLVADGDWAAATEAFEPQVVEPPVYGWVEVAEEWRKAWAACGLT